jgi:formylglycine-generating enzyme required for sulfatase activity
MTERVTIATAQALAEQFYLRLKEHGEVDLARVEACAGLVGHYDVTAPVLYSRLRGQPLFGTLFDTGVKPRFWYEPETIFIPAGPFLMGSEPGEGASKWETPQSEVALPAYRLGASPVTHEQYAEFIRQTGRLIAPEAGWEGQTPPAGKLNHPVMGVTWYDALAYCHWLSEQTGRPYSLPSEAQWEKAARGEDGRLYPWGNEQRRGRCNHGHDQTAAVDAYPPQSVYGCYDLVGNVRQWTTTLWGKRLIAPDPEFYYPWVSDQRRDDLKAKNHLYRVVRGAIFNDDLAQLRCSARSGFDPRTTGIRGKRHGFRVVLNL